MAFNLALRMEIDSLLHLELWLVTSKEQTLDIIFVFQFWLYVFPSHLRQNFILSQQIKRCTWKVFQFNWKTGWKHEGVDPLGTTSKDKQGTKIGEIIFLGPFL